MSSYFDRIFGLLQASGAFPGRSTNTSGVLPSATDFYNPTTEMGRMEMLRNLQNQGGAMSQSYMLDRGIKPGSEFNYISRALGGAQWMRGAFGTT